MFSKLMQITREAMNLLKWDPKFNVEEGIASTIDWYINNHNLIGKLS